MDKRPLKQTTLNSFKIPRVSLEKTNIKKHRMMRRKWSEMDTLEYRNGYPGKKDIPHATKNLQFYKNEIPSTPNGDYIDNIHDSWFGSYDLLEEHHGFIQWESGMNFGAQALQLHEAEAIISDAKATARVIKSYRLMLDFYGMELVNETTGEIQRSENWKPRFRNLNRSMHNYLRITRILKCLGELGLQGYQAPFVDFVLSEALEKETLPNCTDSATAYWLMTVKDDAARQRLIVKAKRLLGIDSDQESDKSDEDYFM